MQSITIKTLHTVVIALSQTHRWVCMWESPSTTALVDVIFVVFTGGRKCRWERTLLQIAKGLLQIIIMRDYSGVKWYLRTEQVRFSFAAFPSSHLSVFWWFPTQGKKRICPERGSLSLFQLRVSPGNERSWDSPNQTGHPWGAPTQSYFSELILFITKIFSKDEVIQELILVLNPLNVKHKWILIEKCI